MAFKFLRRKTKEVEGEEEASHTTPTSKVDHKPAVKKITANKVDHKPAVKRDTTNKVKVEAPKKTAPKKPAPKKAAPEKVEAKKTATADIKVVHYRELVKTEHEDEAAAAEARRRRHLGYN